MKTVKLILFILFSFSLTSNIANAQTNPKNTTQNQQAQNTEVTDKNLKQFNDTVTINLLNVQIVNENGKTFLKLFYSVENKHRTRHIRSINWAGAFTYDNQVFFIQDIPTSFKTPLRARTKTDVAVSVLFEEIPEQARAIFLNRLLPIGALNGAKNITFTNGSKIDVN